MMDDKELPFTKTEYEICEFLAKNGGQVFSKEQIISVLILLALTLLKSHRTMTQGE